MLIEHRPFDDVFARVSAARDLAPRDRAFARLIATTVLRNRGALQAVLNTYIAKPLPEHIGRLDEILLAAAAQLLLLQTPPHAAISLAVDQCRADGVGKRFANLANAVLRRASESGHGRLASLDNVALTFPDWLLSRWSDVYGPANARQIARASLVEPTLDLTVKSDPELWAERIGGVVLPSGSVRVANAGRVEELPGYNEGAWWVQDAAAALPVKLFGDVAGLSVLDLCAAPGGKTAQLAAAGAQVTAIDKSAGRLARLKENLARLGLTADTVVSDALNFTSETKFDAILLDAPCTSTGTIRRHPDILYLKRAEDVAALAALQANLLDRSAGLLKSRRHARLLHVFAGARGRRKTDRRVPRAAPGFLAPAGHAGRRNDPAVVENQGRGPQDIAHTFLRLAGRPSRPRRLLRGLTREVLLSGLSVVQARLVLAQVRGYSNLLMERIFARRGAIP